MDFGDGFPQAKWQNDSIWVLVDRLTKSAHFIYVKSTYHAEYYLRIYIDEIVSLHGIPFSIISDRGGQLTSRFWESFQKGFGDKVKLSTTFHPHGWSSRSYYSNHRRYAKKMCDRLQRELGPSNTVY